MANREQKSKVSFSVFKPKTVQFDKYKDKKFLVGILIGRATGKFERTDQRNDETYVGVKGAFKAVLGGDALQKPEQVAATIGTDAENSIASGICYMPDSWLHPIIDALVTADEAGAVAPTVEFVYAIYLGRRGEQDYEWIVEDLRPVESVDPLAAIMKSAPGMQIEDKREEKAPAKK